jgi:hypothetical protein
MPMAAANSDGSRTPAGREDALGNVSYTTEGGGSATVTKHPFYISR